MKLKLLLLFFCLSNLIIKAQVNIPNKTQDTVYVFTEKNHEKKSSGRIDKVIPIYYIYKDKEKYNYIFYSEEFENGFNFFADDNYLKKIERKTLRNDFFEKHTLIEIHKYLQDKVIFQIQEICLNKFMIKKIRVSSSLLFEE